MADSIKYIVTGKPEYLTAIRMSIGVVADSIGFDMEEVADIKLALEEAVKAVTCHGMNTWKGQYEITCNIEEDKLIILVNDTGEDGEVIEKTYKPCKNCPEDGNLAMMLLEMLMDKVEIKKLDDDKKGILMVKNRYGER